ncbi:Uncharacterised protein [Acinetobacter baumannii]|nr:Uncharacterised protein [Acinetobacter baumannii]
MHCDGARPQARLQPRTLCGRQGRPGDQRGMFGWRDFFLPLAKAVALFC